MWGKPTEAEKQILTAAATAARNKRNIVQGQGKKTIVPADRKGKVEEDAQEEQDLDHVEGATVANKVKVNTREEEGMTFDSGFDIGKGNYDGW